MAGSFKVRTGPDGVHFFDRATGLNILVDEVSVPVARWSFAPRQISVALTNACDLRCPYCYAPKHAATLDARLLTGWLQELDENGCLGVGFGGGEPTLHPDFVWLCNFLAHNTALAITFTTHAHRLTDKLADSLRGTVNFIRVSMDGTGTTYEALRGRSFDQLNRRLNLVAATAPFGINFVVNALTFRDINTAAKVAIQSGAVEFLLLPERPTRLRRGIDPDTRAALADWVNSFRENIRLTVSESDAVGLPICDPLIKEKGLRSYAHIDASGLLKSSSFDVTGVAIRAGGVSRAINELRQLTRRSL
jgi:MoaA/NifB/PqqE/SkfB family radical SAM enzyme